MFCFFFKSVNIFPHLTALSWVERGGVGWDGVGRGGVGWGVVYLIDVNIFGSFSLCEPTCMHCVYLAL